MDLEGHVREALETNPDERWVRATRKIVHDLNNVSGTLRLSLFSLKSALEGSKDPRLLSAAEGVEDTREMLDELIQGIDKAFRETKKAEP